MLFRDSALIDRIFRVFDKDDDNMISFNEYVSCLAILSNKASDEEKLKCTYIYTEYNFKHHICLLKNTQLRTNCFEFKLLSY